MIKVSLTCKKDTVNFRVIVNTYLIDFSTYMTCYFPAMTAYIFHFLKNCSPIFI